MGNEKHETVPDDEESMLVFSYKGNMEGMWKVISRFVIFFKVYHLLDACLHLLNFPCVNCL